MTSLSSLILALLLAFPLTAPVLAATVRDDILGTYALHNASFTIAKPDFCAPNITVSTFTFEVGSVPPKLIAPTNFNILIRHLDTFLGNRRCTSEGSINAVEKDHPFATDELSILKVWARGGWGSLAKWLDDNDTFITGVAKQSWIVGYDFSERVCADIRMRAGVGFLWFQPSFDEVLRNGASGLQIRGGVKMLFLTFNGQPRHGCVYVQEVAGGKGPTSDPSNGGTRAPSTSVSATPTADDEENDDGPPGPDPTKKPSIFDDETDETTDDAPGSCFPASATVELEDGTKRAMSDLRLGDAVRTKHSALSQIFFFSHRTAADGDAYPYVELFASSGAKVTLSPGHYVHANGRLLAASAVRVGDSLTLANGSESAVVRVRRVLRQGKFAPHTLHGDIVVDGVLVSTYTTAVHPRLAHSVLLAPLRWLYRIGMQNVYEGLLDSGAKTSQRFVPTGPDQVHFVA